MFFHQTGGGGKSLLIGKKGVKYGWVQISQLFVPHSMDLPCDDIIGSALSQVGKTGECVIVCSLT